MDRTRGSALARVARLYLRLADAVNRILMVLLSIGMAIMFVAILTQVIVRFLLTHLGIITSVPWTEELARYVLIWIVLLGSAIGCRKGQLIALKYFINVLPARLGKSMQYLALLTTVGYCAFLIWVSFPYMRIGAAEL